MWNNHFILVLVEMYFIDMCKFRQITEFSWCFPQVILSSSIILRTIQRLPFKLKITLPLFSMQASKLGRKMLSMTNFSWKLLSLY